MAPKVSEKSISKVISGPLNDLESMIHTHCDSLITTGRNTHKTVILHDNQSIFGKSIISKYAVSEKQEN